MTNKFNEKINIPIAIPAWSALTIIGGLLFAGGTLSNKMDTVIENGKKNDASIADLREKQVGELAVVSSIAAQIQNHDARITTLERNAIEANAKGGR